MHSSQILPLALVSSVGLAWAAPGDLQARQATNGPRPGTIIWVCTGNSDPKTDIPEVCTNMCYGAFCRGYGTGLTWDKASDNTKNDRAARAGCGKNNHCSTDPPTKNQKYQCDEYPYRSTQEADRTDKKQVNRCVPSGENNRQGARLKQLFYSQGPWKNNQGLNDQAPAKFSQTFSNAGKLRYCGGPSVDCTNDGLEYDRDGKIPGGKRKRGVPVNIQHKRYRLASGEVVTVPDDFEIGHPVILPRAHNSTLFAEHTDNHNFNETAGLEQYDYMLHNLYHDEDHVAEFLGYSD